MAWPCPSDHDPTFQQSEQRQLHLEQQHIRRFEILEDTALGLDIPQNLHSIMKW